MLADHRRRLSLPTSCCWGGQESEEKGFAYLRMVRVAASAWGISMPTRSLLLGKSKRAPSWLWLGGGGQHLHFRCPNRSRFHTRIPITAISAAMSALIVNSRCDSFGGLRSQVTRLSLRFIKPLRLRRRRFGHLRLAQNVFRRPCTSKPGWLVRCPCRTKHASVH